MICVPVWVWEIPFHRHVKLLASLTFSLRPSSVVKKEGGMLQSSIWITTNSPETFFFFWGCHESVNEVSSLPRPTRTAWSWTLERSVALHYLRPRGIPEDLHRPLQTYSSPTWGSQSPAVVTCLLSSACCGTVQSDRWLPAFRCNINFLHPKRHFSNVYPPYQIVWSHKPEHHNVSSCALVLLRCLCF